MGDALARLLDKLVDGQELQDPEFGAFSDLDRREAEAVKERWPSMAVSTRALLLERAGELADVNLDLNFQAIGRLGLDDPDPEVRERAVTTLWESDDRAIANRLAEILRNDSAPGVRAAAALGLQQFVEAYVMERLDQATGERIAAALRDAVDDPDVGVRAGALEASGVLAEDWVNTRILDAYESGERELRIAALRAMGDSASERWVEYISDQLYSSETELRLEAALAAGALGADALVEPLAELLSDEDPEIVLGAIEALGEIGGDEATELLKEYAPHAPEGFEEAIENALGLAQDSGLFRRFGEMEDDE